MNSTCGISLQHTFLGSVGICSPLSQIHLYQERDLKSAFKHCRYSVFECRVTIKDIGHQMQRFNEKKCLHTVTELNIHLYELSPTFPAWSITVVIALLAVI